MPDTMSIYEISQHVDKIVIDEKEFKKIAAYNKTYKRSDGVLDKRMYFPLNTFVLDMTMKKNVRLVALIELKNFSPVNGRATTDNWWFEWRRGENKDGFHQMGEGLTKEELEIIHAFILGAMVYICNQGRNRIEKISEGKERKPQEPYEYKERECFLLRDIIRYYSLHPTKKSLQYRCECWGVRGHIRHYKNGKVCFIKPFKKGKKKDILEPRSKTYLVE